MHDPRVGRFFAVDPLAAQYPHNSVYAFSENRVIDAVELEGLEKSLELHYHNEDGESLFHLITDQKVINDIRGKALTGKYSVFKDAYYNEKSKSNYFNNNPSAVEGIGNLVIDLRMSPVFIDYQNFAFDTAKKKEIENKRGSIQQKGLWNTLMGAIGLYTAGLEEGASARTMTPVVAAQMLWSMDRLNTGLEQLINPNDYLNGTINRDLKYAVTAVLGEGGELIYEAIDLSLGMSALKNPEKMIEYFEFFDTAMSAAKYAKKQNDNVKKQNEKK